MRITTTTMTTATTTNATTTAMTTPTITPIATVIVELEPESFDKPPTNNVLLLMFDQYAWLDRSLRQPRLFLRYHFISLDHRRNCCKDDQQSLWEKANFGTPPTKKPF